MCIEPLKQQFFVRFTLPRIGLIDHWFALGILKEPGSNLVMPNKRVKTHLHAILLGESDDAVRLFPSEPAFRRLDCIRLHHIFCDQPIHLPLKQLCLKPCHLERLNSRSNREEIGVRLC
ncbi:hypothetical protein D3C78_1603270 [compost metagenome]